MQQSNTAHPSKKIIVRLLILLTVIIIVTASLLLYFHHLEIYLTTDDAYVHSNVVSIAPRVSGEVNHVFVQNHQRVQKNQLLFTLDPASFVAMVDQKKAQLKLAQKQASVLAIAVDIANYKMLRAEAALTNAKSNNARFQALAQKNNVSKSQAQQAATQYQQAQDNFFAAKYALASAQAALGQTGNQNANVLNAVAELAQAELNLKYTQIYASADGEIINFALRPGQWAAQGQTLFSLIENQQWWVDANFKETNINHIKEGMPCHITIDMYPNQVFQGVVGYISGGSGAAFSVLPPENATGNWVKVTRRFPVKIWLKNTNADMPLRVGSSATVTVLTNGKLMPSNTYE